MRDQVILVDEHDKPTGAAGKLAAHRSGSLHRALSIFVFAPSGRLLLQRRAASKYHSGGLWSNTCCSHPRPGERTAAAARRRLREEMGFECALTEMFSFVYRAHLGNGLIEHEYDHVFFGVHGGEPVLNPDEADDARWVDMNDLAADVSRRPDAYTFWLAVCLDKVRACSSPFVRTAGHLVSQGHATGYSRARQAG
ncbi:MAG: isopentenyl-diphosphate Delta-isomerase [Ramlibacter sp.]|nr:isopentenyl-diphosphate Delta-isomerase [Ramlibacter sp.]